MSYALIKDAGLSDKKDNSLFFDSMEKTRCAMETPCDRYQPYAAIGYIFLLLS